jgi:glutamate decarboxylase
MTRYPASSSEPPTNSMDPDVAFAIVRDELMLDGNARLKLATFVTTLMEPGPAH